MNSTANKAKRQYVALAILSPLAIFLGHGVLSAPRMPKLFCQFADCLVIERGQPAPAGS